MFLPFDRMWERVSVAREDSDTSLFFSLMYLGEMMLKIVTLGLVSAVSEDRDRHRYRQLHRLVRADSVGEWVAVLEDVLTGPASQFLTARAEQRDLTQKCRESSWQFESVAMLSRCLKEAGCPHDALPVRIDARKWFSLFAQLRNGTRGHGVTDGALCGRISPPLERSIKLVGENLNLFNRSWVFLYRNLSGRYRVTRISGTSAPFDHLRSDSSKNLENGVYVEIDTPCKVELVYSDPEGSDFYFPNGGFNGRRFELISYLSGNKSEADAGPYLPPASELPASQTQGTRGLEIASECFSNLPAMPGGYVNRPHLQSELLSRLSDDTHSIVTLHGSGGIGKTSLALAVLQEITRTERYAAVLWFSARDIDLMIDGPRIVKPHVLTEVEIAKEFVQLMQPGEAASDTFQPLDYLSNALTRSPIYGPLLFVFDNFETVRNPGDLYSYIDTYVRSPNKVLITTRFRDFKGDYPVEVSGMSQGEFDQLCDETAVALRIQRLITRKYRQELFRESEGHPYVVKILLGEVAKARALRKVERIVAGRTEILEALFERTYADLSPAARYVFLTLSSWRSTIPALALEAVMLRPTNERIDVEAALDELKRSSFLETATSPDENTLLSIPLVTAVFGKRKLAVSPMKVAVEANAEILRYLGAAQRADTQHGIGPRIKSLFSIIAAQVGKNPDLLQGYLPIMEFVAQKYPPAWLLLAQLYEESGLEDAIQRANDAVGRYLESPLGRQEKTAAWRKRAEYCRVCKDRLGEVHALIEMSEIPGMSFNEISATANRVNSQLRFYQFLDMFEIKSLVEKLTQTMALRIEGEGDATDCSRLAWLYLRLGAEDEAGRLVELGLRREPNNEYCLKLKDHLHPQQPLFT